MHNSSCACHIPGQVPAYMQRACTYSYWCNNKMNSDNRVRHLATLRKGGRGRRKTTVIKKDSVNFNFGTVNLLATASTINFHTLRHSLFFHTI